MLETNFGSHNRGDWYLCQLLQRIHRDQLGPFPAYDARKPRLLLPQRGRLHTLHALWRRSFLQRCDPPSRAGEGFTSRHHAAASHQPLPWLTKGRSDGSPDITNPWLPVILARIHPPQRLAVTLRIPPGLLYPLITERAPGLSAILVSQSQTSSP